MRPFGDLIELFIYLFIYYYYLKKENIIIYLFIYYYYYYLKKYHFLFILIPFSFRKRNYIWNIRKIKRDQMDPNLRKKEI